ncbi:hypothetical protein GCM10027569_13240 [Flindersiella endophytica]
MTEFPDRADRHVEDPAGHLAIRQPCRSAELAFLRIRAFGQPWNALWGRNREPPSEPTAYGRGLVRIVEIDQRAVLNLLEEHGESSIVALEQQHRSAPRPRGKRRRLVDVARVREGDLQYRRRSVPASYGNNDPDSAMHHPSGWDAAPTIKELLDQPGKRCDPSLTSQTFTSNGFAGKAVRHFDHPSQPRHPRREHTAERLVST